MERDHPNIYLQVIRNLQTWTSPSPKPQMSTHIKCRQKGTKEYRHTFINLMWDLVCFIGDK